VIIEPSLVAIGDRGELMLQGEELRQFALRHGSAGPNRQIQTGCDNKGCTGSNDGCANGGCH
jgi:hypothetical protein